MRSSTELEIVGRSAVHRSLLAKLKMVARHSAEVLLSGPTGVGKELYAAYVHGHSPRADKAFVAVNCANLSAEVMENEIFGHARGAFTGAVTSEHGLAAAADGGTLFLDEIDALPLPCQAKLLRFAQLREYRRLGEPFTRKCDARLITACNADLRALVRAGTFREDLYFRLRVVPVDIPPLAQRRDDIPVLIDHFSRKYGVEYGIDPIRLEPSAQERLLGYNWPGNVRELENCIRYLTCLGLERAVGIADLPLLDEAGPPAEAPAETGAEVVEFVDVPLREAKSMVVEGFERMYLENALRSANGNVAQAARRSGKHRRAFFELMRRYGITAAAYRGR